MRRPGSPSLDRSVSWRGLAASVAAAAMVARGAPASAQPAGADDPIELRWSAPSACPDATRVRADMDRPSAQAQLPRDAPGASAEFSHEDGAGG